MKCDNCGNEIESGLIYCPNCGRSIQLVPNYNVLEEELLSQIVEDKDATKEKFVEGVYNNTESINTSCKDTINTVSSVSKLKPKTFIISLCSFLAVAVLGIVFSLVYSNTHSFEYILDSAQNYEENKQYTNAVTKYKQAVELDDHSFEAYMGLGRSYFEIKDYTNAIATLERVLEIHPESVEAYKYLLESFIATSDSESIYKLADNSPNEEITEMISEYIIVPPSFSSKGGEYSDYVTLFLYSSSGNQIFYTLNGKDPTKSGKKYTDSILLKDGTTTIKAVCKNEDGKYSEVISETYVINYSAPSTPEVEPGGGVFTEPTLIKISVPKNADAYYTWDASTPDETSFLYTEPFYVVEGKHILTVIYIDNHGNKSNVFKGEFTYFQNIE